MRRNVSFAMLATLVIAFTGPALPARAQQRAAQSPREFRISAAQERTVTRSLNATQLRQLNRIASRLAEGTSYRQIQAEWEGFASQLRGSDMDVNALVQFVLHQAYEENQSDLQAYAEKIQHFEESKEAIRGELARIRAFKSALEGGARWTDFRPDLNVWRGIRVISDYQPPAVITRPEAVDPLIKKWEEILASLGDDAQLANVELQNILQKQQQTLQMMSNMAKMLHDTAMAVIRKIGRDDREVLQWREIPAAFPPKPVDRR
ncbi:MAG: hypothetical protein IH876_12020 [Gemmatimonadetes bacterium]|nr:hypothetical protein [Gemmatimonadota bacterium]